MSFLKSLYQSAKQKIEDVFLGEPVKEWGDIFEQQQRFFTEVISIDLHRKNDKLLLWLNSLKRARYLQCARLRDQLKSHAFRIPAHYAWT